MDHLMSDVRQALRGLAKSPGFTGVTVLTLALAIGATSAIFSVVHAVLLRPLAYASADELVAIFADDPRGGGGRNPTTPADFLDWREQTTTLETMTAAHPWSPALTGSGRPDQLSGLKASPSLFDLLGVDAALGRTFTAADEAAGETRVVVLGYDLWRRRFGGDRELVGRSLTLDGEPYRVLGVMPPGFRFPPFWATGAELWVPLVFTPEQSVNRRASFLRVFARRRPGVTFERAATEMGEIAGRLRAAYPEDEAGRGVRVEPLHEPTVEGARGPLVLLFAAIVLVLLVACSNVAGLLATRAAARDRELAIRAALGAGRGRLARQWLVESLLLALAGGGAGVVLAVWGVELLTRFGPADLPRLGEVGVDGPVLAFTLTVAVATGLLFGVAPALRAARPDLVEVMGRGGRRTAGGGTQRLRSGLVVGQVALALILLVGAGLLLASFARQRRIDPGFRSAGLMTMGVALAGSAEADPERQNPFFDRLLARVGALPSVADAALVHLLPIGGDLWSLTLAVEGVAEPPTEERPAAAVRVVTPGYFSTLDVPLVRGRGFDAGDRAQSPQVAIVNQTLARRFFADADPVGRRIRVGGDDEPWRTVVGVAGDVRQWSVTDEVRAEVYVPYAQNLFPWWTTPALVVRAASPAAAPGVGAAARDAVWALDRDLPVIHLRAMDEILAGQLAGRRFEATLLALFAGVALLLAAVGIYGVIGYLVRRRGAEFGIRLALGADRRDIFQLVVGRGLILAAAGAAAGLAGALALSRTLGGLLDGLSPTDPATYAAVVAVLLAATAAASWLPARRATRIDPVTALREE